MLSPTAIRNQALAYFIWCFATKEGWNVTLRDIAEAARDYFKDGMISVDVVRGICMHRRTQGKRWLDLVRVTAHSDGFRADE
jgi:hypothetical protein